MNNIKVDILMATYNGEKYIRQQIDSILNQTYSNFDLIIYDDCSKDNTRAIIEEYVKKDKRVKIIFGKKNIGSTKAFEKLYNISDAEYFMFCDQDDVWLQNKVEKSLNKICKTKKLLVFTDLKVVNKKLDIISESFFSLMKMDCNRVYNWKKAILGNVAPGCTMIINKEIKKYIKIIPQGYILHDWWIVIISSFMNSIEVINEPLILYRQHENNQVGTKNSNKNNNIFKRFITNKIQYVNNLNSILYFLRVNEIEHMFVKQVEFMKKYIRVIEDASTGKGYTNNFFNKYRFILENIFYIEDSTKNRVFLLIILLIPKQFKIIC